MQKRNNSNAFKYILIHFPFLYSNLFVKEKENPVNASCTYLASILKDSRDIIAFTYPGGFLVLDLIYIYLFLS